MRGSAPGSAGFQPATGRRPAIVQAGKMPAHPEGRFALQDDFHAEGWADTGSWAFGTREGRASAHRQGDTSTSHLSPAGEGLQPSGIAEGLLRTAISVSMSRHHLGQMARVLPGVEITPRTVAMCARRGLSDVFGVLPRDTAGVLFEPCGDWSIIGSRREASPSRERPQEGPIPPTPAPLPGERGLRRRISGTRRILKLQLVSSGRQDRSRRRCRSTRWSCPWTDLRPASTSPRGSGGCRGRPRRP